MIFLMVMLHTCHLAWLSGLILESCALDWGWSDFYVIDWFLGITIETLDGILWLTYYLYQPFVWAFVMWSQVSQFSRQPIPLHSTWGTPNLVERFIPQWSHNVCHPQRPFLARVPSSSCPNMMARASLTHTCGLLMVMYHVVWQDPAKRLDASRHGHDNEDDGYLLQPFLYLWHLWIHFTGLICTIYPHVWHVLHMFMHERPQNLTFIYLEAN